LGLNELPNFLLLTFHPREKHEPALFSRSPDSGIHLLTRPSHPEQSEQWHLSGFRPPSQLRGSGGFSPRFPLLKGFFYFKRTNVNLKRFFLNAKIFFLASFPNFLKKPARLTNKQVMELKSIGLKPALTD